MYWNLEISSWIKSNRSYKSTYHILKLVDFSIHSMGMLGHTQGNEYVKNPFNCIQTRWSSIMWLHTKTKHANKGPLQLDALYRGINGIDKCVCIAGAECGRLLSNKCMLGWIGCAFIFSNEKSSQFIPEYKIVWCEIRFEAKHDDGENKIDWINKHILFEQERGRDEMRWDEWGGEENYRQRSYTHAHSMTLVSNGKWLLIKRTYSTFNFIHSHSHSL